MYSGFDAESLTEALSKTTPTKIPYKPPFNWSLLTSVIMLILSLLLSIRLILPVLASRWTWAVAITLGIIVFTSGVMFVRIRGSPWAGRGKQGTTWLASGYQNQYGMEIQVMAGICKWLSCVMF
jgi:oligosaccharyltransferase complex subunit gamma